MFFFFFKFNFKLLTFRIKFKKHRHIFKHPSYETGQSKTGAILELTCFQNGRRFGKTGAKRIAGPSLPGAEWD